MARQQQDDEKSSTRGKERNRKVRDISPYSKNFKCYVKSDERDLIYKRQTVIKLSRKDLEDKYIELCDENFFMKRHNNELHDRIKELTAKLVRISSTHRCFSTSAILKERTSENVTETSRTDPRFNSSYQRPIIRSASLSNICKRHLKSAPLSECNKSASSSTDSQKSAQQKGPTDDSDQKNKPEKGVLESPEKNKNKIEEKLVALQKRIVHLNEEIKAEQEKYAQVLKEKEELEKNFSDMDMKKYLESSVETTRLKRKLGELVCFTKRMQTDFKVALCEKDHLLEIERAKYNSMMERLKCEEANESKNLLIELKSALRNVDLLTKTVSELENDKKLLLDQQTTFSNLLKEGAFNREAKKAEPSPVKDNTELLEQFNELKNEKTEIKTAQIDLISKVKDLQDINKKLLTELEEIKVIQQHSERMRKQDIFRDLESKAEASPKEADPKTTNGTSQDTNVAEVAQCKDKNADNTTAKKIVEEIKIVHTNPPENTAVESQVVDSKASEKSENTNPTNENKTVHSERVNIEPVHKETKESQTVEIVSKDSHPKKLTPLHESLDANKSIENVNASSQTDVRKIVVTNIDGEVSDTEVTTSEALDSKATRNDNVVSEIEDGEVEEGEIVAIALRIAITR